MSSRHSSPLSRTPRRSPSRTPANARRSRRGAARNGDLRAQEDRDRAAQTARARMARAAHFQAMLTMLEEREEERRAEIERFPVDPIQEEGDGGTAASPCPILDGVFRDGGASARTRMPNFSPRELNTLWYSVRGHVLRYWKVGRGRRSTFAAKDVFFIMLAVVKNGGTWEMLARIFRIKTPTFIKTITGFIEVVASKLYEEWIDSKQTNPT